MSERKDGFEERLNKYPYLRSRFETIMDTLIQLTENHGPAYCRNIRA